MQSIGKTIRLLRHQQSWSQEEMAKKLGISIPAYSKIETGITDMNLSRAEQIAEVFGLSVLRLLAGMTAPDQHYQSSLKAVHDRLRDREQEVLELQRKVIELFEQTRQQKAALSAAEA